MCEADQIGVDLIAVFGRCSTLAIDLDQEREIVSQVALLMEELVVVLLQVGTVVECVPFRLNLLKVLLLDISLVLVNKSKKCLRSEKY
jgi:hypothetical protein